MVKVKQQAGKLQVFDPQDLFNRLISLVPVLTSGGGDGLPISLTKIMGYEGYELSQFPASLFETEYLMLATNKPRIIQMLIKAFYKLEGADRVVQKKEVQSDKEVRAHHVVHRGTCYRSSHGRKVALPISLIGLRNVC